MNNNLNPEQNWFGDKQVEPEEKTELVNSVFHSVAYKYDLMNDLMSAGKHRLWKNRFVRDIRPNNNHKILDVAGGTGDIAFRILKKAPSASITVYDYQIMNSFYLQRRPPFAADIHRVLPFSSRLFVSILILCLSPMFAEFSNKPRAQFMPFAGFLFNHVFQGFFNNLLEFRLSACVIL